MSWLMDAYIKPLNMTRESIRQHIRQKRRELNAAAQQHAADLLAHHLSIHPLFQQAQSIAAYIACDAEMDPSPLLEIAWQQKKQCYLPVLQPEFSLCFVQYKAGDSLTLNRYKIPEPEYDPAKIIAPELLDLVLIPLVGFDLKGNRLGMGAGYYDRTFAFKKNLPGDHKPFLIGLGYELQKLPILIAEHWDVPLTAVATEREIYVI